MPQTNFYLGNQMPRMAMKPITIFFYGEGEAQIAKQLASEKVRSYVEIGITRDASTFVGEHEPADAVVIMPNVLRHHEAKIRRVYSDICDRMPEGPKTDLTVKPAHAEQIEAPGSHPALDGDPQGASTANTARPFEKMKNSQLRDECVRRGIGVKGVTDRTVFLKLLAEAEGAPA